MSETSSNPPDETTASRVAITVQCPACNEALEATPGDVALMIPCPTCGRAFVLPAVDGSTEVPAPADAGEDDDREGRRLARREMTREQELDALRMRQIVATKRSAIRSRTYCVVGAVAALIGAAKLVEMTVRHVGAHGWEAKPVGYVLFVAALGAFGLWCVRRANYWQAEMRVSPLAGKCPHCLAKLEEGARTCPSCGGAVNLELPAPDFTTLQDGSQFAKELEDVK
ncbi:MAG TPA: hypothetical protein VEA69_07400 [Tepidisphaeraceae bacterium]|nr:hypothetical protein [Tepidisphaeraceae bacterium]